MTPTTASSTCIGLSTSLADGIIRGPLLQSVLLRRRGLEQRLFCSETVAPTSFTPSSSMLAASGITTCVQAMSLLISNWLTALPVTYLPVPSGSNHIRIIALEGEGWLFINGAYVDKLDLSGLLAAGGVHAVGSYFTGHGIAGKSTRFEDFTIWFGREASRERFEANRAVLMPMPVT